MNYAQQQRDPRRHFVGIGSVVLIHVIVVYALVNGLARKVVEVLKKPIDVNIIEEVKLAPPPKTPPPKIVTPPPPPTYVPPPEVAIAAPPQAVAAVTQAPPPPPPPVAARPAVVNVAVACPNHLEVRNRTPYPPQASRMGLSGDVLIEFTVTPAGGIADIAVIKSSNKVFESAAAAAVAQFQCIGQGQAVKVRVPFIFRLEN